MKLSHDWVVFQPTQLNVDPSAYGLDTTQLSIYANGTIKTSAAYGSEIATINLLFDPNLDVLVSLSEDITTRMANSVAGTIKHQNYTNPDNPLYTELAATLNTLNSGPYASQIVGVRWNHEYRPTYWDYGSDWWTWASSTNQQLASACNAGGARAQEWATLLNTVRSNTVPSRDWFYNYGQATVGAYGGTEYDLPKQLYAEYFVSYHCKLEASIINNIAATLNSINNSWVFLVYGAMIGPGTTGVPSVHGPSEYSCDWNLSTATNIVWEIGGFDKQYTAPTDINGFAYNAGSRRFQFAMQQNATNAAGTCPLTDVMTYTQRRLDATNAAGSGPWAESFGWWTNWRKDADCFSTEYMATYLAKIGSVLL
jgi:hypothetical protein